MTSQKRDAPPLQRPVLSPPFPSPKSSHCLRPFICLCSSCRNRLLQNACIWLLPCNIDVMFHGAVLQLFLSFPFICPTSIFPLSWNYYDLKWNSLISMVWLLAQLMKASVSSQLLRMLRQEDNSQPRQLSEDRFQIKTEKRVGEVWEVEHLPSIHEVLSTT